MSRGLVWYCCVVRVFVGFFGLRIAKSSVGVFSVSILVTVVGFVGTIFAARVVGADGLGVFYLFTAVVSLVSFFTKFGVGGATTKRVSEGRRQGELLTASLIISFVLFLVTSVFLYFFGGGVVDYIGSKWGFYLVFPSLLLLSINQVVGAGLSGEKKVALSHSLSLGGDIVRVSAWVFLLLLGTGVVGLFFGYLLGLVTSVVLGFVFLSIRLKKPSRGDFRSLFSYSKFSWLGGVRGRAWSWTDTIVLGFFVSSSFVGVYEACWKISALFYFGATAISESIFPEISEWAAKNQITKIEDILEESLVWVGLISIPGFLGALVLGRSVLSVYGKEFTIGYLILVVLAFARLLHSYETGFSRIINGLNRPDLMFKVNLVFLTLNIGGNIILVSLLDWIGAAIATTASMAIGLTLTTYYTNKLIKITVPWKEITKEFIAATLMATLIYPIHLKFKPLDFIQTLLAVSLGTTIYLTILLTTSKRIRTKIQKLIKEITTKTN
ncbi:MAG: MATE family membrane protein Rfbx family AglR [Candidatus Methanohalarchaeum thermophilum]|uniref:MATE family membrane protein Rfbx family AglR n=1 Tax=Methanohalarchaeum thermophilum TaxID=1903181 RepID=A0A1Q6DSV3_METT1|nr:MAG: MATE family membrane protein Rfbx family AglR [Candidatus Methanohalarchaeum thermophilum]